MIEYWHNPRCSKSRAGVTLLNERGVDVNLRLYLQDAPDAAQITAAWNALGQPPVVEMMRTGENLFKELGLSKSAPDEVLFAAMAAHPILIERPLAISGARAVIGRPIERLLELL
jgi:arsenate reductase